MMTLIVAIIPLVLLIFKEFFSAQADAKAANVKFTLDQETLQKIVNSALQKQVARMAADSQGVANAQDAADADAKKNQGSDRVP